MAKQKPISITKRPVSTATPKKKGTVQKRNQRVKKTLKVRKKSAVIFARQKSALTSAIDSLSSRVSQISKKADQVLRTTETAVTTAKTTAATTWSSAQKATMGRFAAIALLRKKKAKKTKPKLKKPEVKKPLPAPKSKPKKSKPKTPPKNPALKALYATAGFIRRELFGPFEYIFRYHFWASALSILASVLILASAYVVYDVAFKDLPSVNTLTERKQILTTKILDRNGQVLYRIFKDENRTLIHLSDVPTTMKQATIAIEDRNFYTHHGISIRGIGRALFSNAQSDSVQGGSTITQQLVKNTLLSPERTFKRKIREILLAILVEGRYTKDEILEMYFNEVAYGGSTYGVEEAAQKYFGKSAHDLDLAESAFLAGLPAAPSVYSPFGATPEYAYTRQHEVLQRMVEDHYITDDQRKAAENETLKFNQNMDDIKAPHFVMYVKSLLEKTYGEDVVAQGGLEIRTTLDLNTQNQAQGIVTKELDSLARLNISNGAALVTNPQTGEILAMVGSKNYFDFANDGQVNVTLRPRQPGSSIKALTYSIAFEKGLLTPSSTIVDEPTVFNTAGSPPYAPKNYDGRFHGNVTAREALASSYNIPAVKTLASIGISTMIDKAQQMGVTTWDDRKRFGLSLTLGGGEVLMTELAQIYGTFATYGQTVTLNPILEVKNYKGDVLYQNTCALDKTDCPATRNLDPKVAYQITDILSDNVARTPAFGPNSVLYIPNQQVAVKTGTTNDLRDNWSIGYTENRLVAVWVGNNNSKPMSYVASGITGASPIWNKIMRTQLDDAHPHVFPTPDGLVKVAICVKTNTLPCRGCPWVRDEVYIPGTQPTQACSPEQFYRPKPSPSPSAGTDKILQGITTGQ